MPSAIPSCIQDGMELHRMQNSVGWTLEEWQQVYLSGQEPATVLSNLLTGMDADDPAWISLLSMAQLKEECARLTDLLASTEGDLEQLPLFGVPFAVKDNIDALGFETTAGCAEFAYTPTQDAFVVARLKSLGAVMIGKTNLDQFATGLVGTRSPYGAVPNSFDGRYISGGSSSGSASVVARGFVPFALGTDTAGSGRVPAGLNNLVGLKGTRGAISIGGVVPACRSLDVVSIFALTLDDAATVFDLAAVYDPAEAYSRPVPNLLPQGFAATPRLGIPQLAEFKGDATNEQAWRKALADWERLGAELVPLDFAPFLELAALLYEGPWVAERHAAIADFMKQHFQAMNPVVRGIITQAEQYSATDAFNANYRRAELLRQIEQSMDGLDALLVPTAPTFPTLEAVQANPVQRNSELGIYTNFVNLADLCALAIPAGFRADGLPFGVTLIGRAWHDKALQALAGSWLAQQNRSLGATGRPAPASKMAKQQPVEEVIRVAMVGAHLTGMPLNGQLTERGAVLVEQTTTAPHYRLFALANTQPPKPGLQRTTAGEPGAAITVELWDMPMAYFGSFVGLIPQPLGIGSLELADGRWVKGFICEHWALEDATDITEFGGWRRYLSAAPAA